jgi:hypothetical protein
MKKNFCVSLAVSACLALAACGGGSSGNSNSSNTPAPGPALADTVLFSNSAAADSVTAVINKAGIIRAVGEGADQSLSIAGGTMPMTGNANSATGGGWLASGNSFAAANVTLSVNSDGKSYTLSAQGSGVQASNAIMQAAATDLVTPTLSALTGHFGITSSWAIDIDGSTFSGTYGYNCTIAGTLSANAKTVDLTNVTFQRAGSDLNPAGNPCPFAGKTWSGMGFLLAPSATYAKGAFDIVFDDGASGTPTSVNLFNYIRQ